MTDTFDEYAYFYNLFYKDKDYAKETQDVDSLLEKYGIKNRDIIVYGCGTGSHDREFINLGYRCHGVDMSSGMIDVARKFAAEGNYDIQYEVGDIRIYEPARQYDAVVSLFHVISYQNSNEDIINSFRSARRAVDTGGLFLFDAWYGPGVLTDRPVVRIKEVEDERNKLIRHARPVMHADRDVVDVNYEILIIDKETSIIKTINEVHQMRYFFKPEISYFLENTGFKLLAAVSCDTLKEADYSSWTAYFVAKAI